MDYYVKNFQLNRKYLPADKQGFLWVHIDNYYFNSDDKKRNSS